MREPRPSAGVVAVVPVFNEAATVAAVVGAVGRVCPVVVVDDGSTDGSAERARAAGALVVTHGRRRGKGAALRAGFAAALAMGARAVVTVDGDGQHDGADLPRLLAAAAASPEALVLGDRLAGRGDPVPLLRRLAIGVADRVLGWLTGTRLRDSQCGLRVYPARFLRAVPLREEGFVLETEALVIAVRAGHPVVSVPVRARYPAARAGRFRALADTGRIAWYLTRVAVGEALRRLGPATTPVPAVATGPSAPRRAAGRGR